MLNIYTVLASAVHILQLERDREYHHSLCTRMTGKFMKPSIFCCRSSVNIKIFNRERERVTFFFERTYIFIYRFNKSTYFLFSIFWFRFIKLPNFKILQFRIFFLSLRVSFFQLNNHNFHK